MSEWNEQLRCIREYIPGCAIVTLKGEICATEGIWPSTPEEMHSYTYFFANDIQHHPLIFVGNDKYFVNMMTPIKLLAMHARNVIALHRTNKLYVAGYSDGSIEPKALMKMIEVFAEYLAENGL